MKAKKVGDYVRAVPFAESFPPGNVGIFIDGFSMNRKQLEHVLRASGSVSGCREIVILGSQAILGAYPKAPANLVFSMEVDLYPLDAPDKADLIDGCLGEMSPFHETFGYYAHGVGPETAALPAGWKKRLVRLENANTGGTIGWCLSPADLAISKLMAGREKDIDFIRGMFKSNLITEAAIKNVLGELKCEDAELALARLSYCLNY
ncbi:MAG: hypothetical protein NTV79_09880 [Candidatus Aureabacteria bacterium]|nr:hypothetical protein [Candidatus Auribacterota bacterium]